MKVGTTTFSFTNEWLAGGSALEQLLGRISEHGLGPGLEVIGFQVWRDFPHLTSDEILTFRRACDSLGLEPTALGAYADLARHPGRLMSTGEAVGYLRPQIDVAAALGFPVVRLHSGIPFEVIEHVTPLAEDANVILATEIQGHQTPDDPTVLGLLELRERLDTPAVALTLDFSVAMCDVPAAFTERLLEVGMDAAEVDGLVARWRRGETVGELFNAIHGIDAPPPAVVEALSGFVRFGRQRPEDWLPLVPAVAYAHAKFWEAHETGDDPTVRTADICATLAEGEYDGVVSVEWGGNAWREVDEVDAFEQVRRHRGFCERLVSVSAQPRRDPEYEGRGQRQTFAAT